MTLNKEEQALLDYFLAHTKDALRNHPRTKQLIHDVKASGLREAAEIVNPCTDEDCHNEVCLTHRAIHKSILTAAEKPL